MSPFFVALPVALLVVFLLPDLFPRYKVRLSESGHIDKPGGFEYYDDLDDDGTSERIILFNNTEGKASLKILTLDGEILHHYYFSGEIIPSSGSLVTGRFDPFRPKGIFLMTRTSDSILLQGICPNDRDDTLLLNYPVSWFHPENTMRDLTLPGFFLKDMDGDGKSEIISGIMAGFHVEPRMLFIYNLETGELIKTPRMGACVSITDISDLDADGRPEILLHTYAISNNEGKEPLPLNDHCAWLLVFTPRLEYFFPPIEFEGKYTVLTSFSLGSGVTSRIVSLYYGKTKEAGTPKLLLFDFQGHLLREISIPDHGPGLTYNLIKPDGADGHIFLTSSKGSLFCLDTALNIADHRRCLTGQTGDPLKADLDGDNKSEMVFYGGANIPGVIVQGDFSDPVAIRDLPMGNFIRCQSIHQAGKSAKVYFQTGDKSYLYTYFANPLYWFKYPIYLLIYLIILGFILLIGYFQRQVLHQRYLAQQKIAGMQLLLLKNQWDPHFTYNAISAISINISNGDSDEANRKLISLSKLMRSGVLQSNRLSRSLAEELEFLQQYVQLVENQPDRPIKLNLEIDPEVDLGWEVPRMITQIHTENAIRHGLRRREGDRRLTIRALYTQKRLLLEIEDNGIGRKAAKELGEHGTGKGMAIAEQITEIFNRYNQQKIEMVIEDLVNPDGTARGTLVRFSIPVGMKYDVYKG